MGPVDRVAAAVRAVRRLGRSTAGRGDVDAGGATPRVREYWEWIAVALFLFATVDTITTVYAASLVGPAGEANPLVRWTLERGVWALAAVNVGAVLLVAGLFYGVVRMLDRTPPPYDRYFAAVIEIWLGGLLSAGLLVFANNLSVIVLGRSLL